jgi:hypothetical protein
MSSYTPAPWTVDGLVTKDLDVISPDGRIAMIDCDGIDPDTLEANARLISASPELLNSLQELVEYLGVDVDNGLDELLTNARAAITKATGNAV